MTPPFEAELELISYRKIPSWTFRFRDTASGEIYFLSRPDFMALVRSGALLPFNRVRGLWEPVPFRHGSFVRPVRVYGA